MKPIPLLLLIIVFVGCNKDSAVEGEQYTSLPTPGNLAFSSTSAAHVTIYWEDNNSAEDGFIIERQRGLDPFGEVGRVVANETSYDDYEVDTLYNYSYRLRAFQGSQYSDYSQALRIAFLPEEESLLYQLDQHSASIGGVAFAPNDATLVSTSRDYGTKLWAVPAGTLVWSVPGYATKVAFSISGELLAIGGWLQARICLVSSGETIRTLEDTSGYVGSVAFSPDGQIVVTGTQANSNRVRLWRVSNGTLIRTISAPTSYVYGIAFSPDGMSFAVTARDGAELYGVSDGALLRRFTGGGYPGTSSTITDVKFSPDGTLLAVTDAYGSVRMWTSSDAALLRSWVAHSGIATSINFSADGQMLVTSGSDSVAAVWRVSDGALLRVFSGQAWVNEVALNPSGTILAAACDDRSVRAWDLNYQSPRRWKLLRP